MAHISQRVTQFSYFDQALGHPTWQGRKVLDFGGNVAGFLVGAEHRVDHDDYWCLDVDGDALEEGRRRFPAAHFVHFDRYSSEFNPQGTRYLPVPDLGPRFDFILAFSVFTHTHQREMLELVAQLRALLAPGGALAFTFCDARHDRARSDPTLPPGSDLRKHLSREQARNPSIDIEAMIDRGKAARWCLLIDDKLLAEPDESWCHQERQGKPGESYCAYFQENYLASLLPGAQTVYPISPDWQHCCILRCPATAGAESLDRGER